MPLYEGPIVDSHHHTIWNHELNYPWMNKEMKPMIFGDDWSGMKQEYSIEKLLLDYKYINNGDIFVLTAGIPIGVSGATNMLKIQKIKE